MRRFDIWQSERESAEVVAHGLRVRKDGLVATIWHPKATKPVVHTRFRSEERRDEYVQNYVDNFGKWQAEKEASRAARKERSATLSHTVDVGAIFVNSWGYDQTNVDYYQVVEKHGQNVVVREIGGTRVPGSEGFDCDRVMPAPGAFLEPRYEGDKTGAPLTKRLYFGSDGTPHLAMDHGSCSLWTGGSHYRSWYH